MGGDITPIKYDKLLKLLEENGYTSYRLKKENVIGQATLTAIKKGTGGIRPSFHRQILPTVELSTGRHYGIYS